MAEIFDLLARVSWDTNAAELDKLNAAMKQQDKTLEELRLKGRRLEDQLVKTNDPKKQAALTAELKKTAQAADAIVKGQQKQVDLQKQLTQRAKELGTELRKANDPKQVQGLLRELHKVEKQLDAMGNKANIAGGKMSGIMDKVGGLGQSVLAGAGLGAGMFGVEAIVGGVMSQASEAIAEFEAAERTTRLLQGTLRSLGQEEYFEGLMREANQLAETFSYLDNDDIVDAQQKLLTYGKLTRQEISSLLPIIIDFAARTGKDIPSATEMVIGALEGQGRQLKQYGINLKDAETFTERLALVQGTLGEKVKGAAQDFMQSSEGIKAAAEQQRKDVLEQYGQAASEVELFFKGAIANLYTFIKQMGQTAADEAAKFNKKQLEDGAGRLESMSKKELEFEMSLQATRQQNIKDSQARENNIREEMRKKGRDGMSRKEYQEKERQLQAEKEYQDKYRAEIYGVNLAWNSIEERERKKAEADKRAAAERASAETVKSVKAASDKAKATEKKTEPVKIQIAVDFMGPDGQPLPDAPSRGGIQGFFNTIYDNLAKLRAEQEKTAREESERQSAARQARRDEDEADRKKKREWDDEDAQRLFDEVVNATSVAQQILSIEQEKTDRLIELQQQRVDAAKDNSKVSLKIEEDRLNALLERRQKYERAQRAIDAAVIVANQAVAISGAIRAITDAGGNPVLIAANAIAIAASIAAAIAAVRSGFGDVGFKEGGYTGDGDPNQESTAVGRRPYKYHKGEFVMDADLTADHRDLFEGIHKRRLKVRQLDDGQYYIAPDVDKLSADYQTAKYSTQDGQVLAELSAMRRLMQQREVSVTNNFDADGFGQAVASQMGQIHLKNLRRN